MEYGLVLTPTGFKELNKISSGDLIFNSEGKTVKIDKVIQNINSKVFKITDAFDYRIVAENDVLKYESILSAEKEETIRKIQVDDYLFYPKIQGYIKTVAEIFNIKKYWPVSYLNDGYDVYPFTEDLKVPPAFLAKALSIGVPEDSNNYIKLKQYMDKKGYKDLEEFAKKVLETNSKKVKSMFKIDTGFLYIVILNLLGYIRIVDDELTISLDEVYYKYLKDITIFLNKNNINVTVQGHKHYKNITNLIINSQLMNNIIIDDFNSYDFLYSLDKTLSNLLVNAIRDYPYLECKKYESVNNLKAFLYMDHSILTNEDQVFDNQYVLNILKKDDDYLEVVNGFYTPIQKIEQVFESVACRCTYN